MKIISYRRRKAFFFILVGIVIIKILLYFVNFNNANFQSAPSKFCDLTAAKRIIENLVNIFINIFITKK